MVVDAGVHFLDAIRVLAIGIFVQLTVEGSVATSRIVTKRHVVDLSSALPTVEENGVM